MKKGIFSVAVANILTLFLCFYWIFSYLSPISAKQEEKETVKLQSNTENPLSYSSKAEEAKASKTESKLQNSSQQTTSSKTDSLPASAKGIKGKILSQYISPYNSANSYDKVYIKNLTGQNISIKKYLEKDIKFKITKNSSPQVLILHTHATESFKTDNKDYYTTDFNSRSRNKNQNMLSVGKIVADKLNHAGIRTLTDTTLHDYPSYTNSYSRSAQTICNYLKKYPTIKVVLDLHRDAVTKENGDKVKLLTNINNKKAAQVMLVMGSGTGGVTNFPKWEENFALACRLQRIMEKNYPTLARPLMLASKNYNQSLSTGAMLIEFGTDVNTLEEVHYSAELVGNCLAQLLGGL